MTPPPHPSPSEAAAHPAGGEAADSVAAWAGAAVVRALASRPAREPLILGMSGPQGSGKSTVAAQLAARFAPAATLSLDDFYLPLAAREAMARGTHPLLRTRGPPGTHDVTLGLRVLGALRRGEPVALPRFDKGRDDRAPAETWPRTPAHPRLVIFEGWCLGAPPQTEAELREPVNALEREEDEDGRWRRFVDARLRDDYPPLFAAADLRVALVAPDFATVVGWRREAETRLRATGAPAAMNDAALARFMSHYERLTTHLARHAAQTADLVLLLDGERRVVSASGRS